MHSRIPRRTALLCTVAAAVFALAGAATSVSAPVAAPPASPIKALSDSLKGLSLPAREAKLLDLAKKEGGTLELYTSLSSLITRNLLPAFEKAYPGIKVNLYRASSETLTQRILSEVSAGVAGPDVIETNGTEMSFFQNKKNVLVPYRQSPYAAGIPKRYQFDTFTAARLEAFVTAWTRTSCPPGSSRSRIPTSRTRAGRASSRWSRVTSTGSPASTPTSSSSSWRRSRL